MGALDVLVIAIIFATSILVFMVKQFRKDNGPRSSVPQPAPILDFDLKNARARPYRPLRWPYHQTMALQRLDLDYWLEIESSYVERIKQRKYLHAEHGKLILDCLPGSEEACQELMFLVVDFLCARYPSQFSLDGHIFSNRILGKNCLLDEVKPLNFLLDHVPEDFAIILPNEVTGVHTLRAGVVCSAVGWSLGSKLGLPLDDIHAEVPKYSSKLQPSMNRYFQKLSVTNPIQRGSWSLEIGPILFLQSDHPSYPLRKVQSPELRPEDVCFRVDWQTLRRLPNSQAIVFNFKALFTPLYELREEPYIPGLLRRILEEGDPEILEYKSVGHVCHAVLPKLKLWEVEQRQNGLVDCKDIRTLDENPFFPQWEILRGFKKRNI
ncbi:hypothetical protein DL96DRAFT_1598737 [Flagelloscypha sp. PMI_526]|nr:hypothetical protein DL96DRAFT_1598737 [Flagelloscypha sp. PMI_526]